MTVAEKMADDFIVAAEGGPLAAELGKLIIAVARTGVLKAKLTVAYDPPITTINGARYVRIGDAQDAIDLDRWWEEEAK